MLNPSNPDYVKRRKSCVITCLALMLSAIALPLSAQQVSREQAYTKAKAFLGLTSMSDTSQRKTPRKAPTLQLASSGDKLYIFNDVANGGYVIVSGDERMPEVLGYSESGHIDPTHMPCNLQMMLDDCTRKVDELRADPHAAKINAPQAAQVTPIAPLLGATAWEQDWPYNLMCPEVDGQHCPAGCVATATAQIMYYHKWPAKGQGSHSYEWNGQTLSANFSQSTYKWSKMLPVYEWDSSEESCNAVALLMRDVGYSCDMNYSPGGSGAIGQDRALITYFDYDASMGFLERANCDEATWNNYIMNELNNSRPLFYSGGSTIGGHALVIDGVDSNGFYHFNFGVGEETNGYFSKETLFFNKAPSINFGIKKDAGGSPTVLFGTPNDFVFNPESGQLSCSIINTMSVMPVESVTAALAIENKKTHKVKYYDEGNKNTFEAPSTLSDGNYILYPVARLSDSDEWQKLLFADYRQQFVDLNVKNGDYTYSNNGIVDFIQEGAVDINGIVYFLDESTQKASVTFRNDRYNHYKDTVDIPEKVTYKKQKYTVAEIGENAFMKSDADLIKIPKSVTSFAFASFAQSLVGKVVFDQDSHFKTVEPFAFNAARIRSRGLDIPEGTEEMGNCAFQTCWFSRISIPSTVNSLWGSVFNYCHQFRVMLVGWQTPLAVTDGGYMATFNGFDLGLCWLFVPKGTASKYRKADTWKKFGHIVEMSDTVTANGVKYVLSDTDGSAYLLAQENMSNATVSIPRTINYNRKAYTVQTICPYAFANEAIRDLTIPSTVTYFGEGGFHNYPCPIEHIRFHGKTPPVVPDPTDMDKEDFWTFMDDTWQFGYVTLHVPKGSKSKYKADSFWGQFTNIVEDASLGKEGLKGDVNNDNVISMKDAIDYINYVLGKNPSNFVLDNADLNGDNVISMKDVIALINLILNK